MEAEGGCTEAAESRVQTPPRRQAVTRRPLTGSLTPPPLCGYIVPSRPLGVWVGRSCLIHPSPHPTPSRFFTPGRSVIRVLGFKGPRTLPL